MGSAILITTLQPNPARQPLQGLVRWFLRMVVLMVLQCAVLQGAQAQEAQSEFNHNATGFVLNAQHQGVRCETCHVKGQFKGTPTRCESCHGWNNPRASTVMPADHIPTRNAPCQSCHAPNMARFQDALRVFSHVSVPAMSCLDCHDSRKPHPGVRSNPSDPTHAQVLASNTACGSCHTTLAFEGPKPPSNHIPVAAVPCANCHLGPDFTVMPGIAAIHANAPTPGSNCAQCHSASAAVAFAMPHMQPALVGPPANHIPMGSQACETCHVGPGSSVQLPVVQGASFSGALFTHSGITSGCATCHGANVNPGGFAGISRVVVMPASGGGGSAAHIPTSAPCESCHALSTPAGLIAPSATATVPGTGFQSPAPGKAQIHSGVSSGCASCHEGGMAWLGMTLYPMAGYTGFQTRPQGVAGTFNVASQSHPRNGACEDCHIGISFDPANIRKPANHIPVAAGAACIACHNPSDYSEMPKIAAIHANAPAASMQSGATNCAQCHSSTNAALYAMPTMVPSIVTPPPTHIGMGSLDCGSCHVGSNSSLSLPVPNGASFANSAFSHSGISSGCAACHGDAVVSGTFYGVNPKTRMGLTPQHIPNPANLACEVCHVASIPATLVPATGATSGMTTFAGGKFSHSGISSGCAACHGPSLSSGSFYGVSSLVVMPPSSPAGANAHLPTSTTCENCHAGSQGSTLYSVTAARSVPGSGFATPVPTAAMIHAGTTAGCTSCHEAGQDWVGVSAYPRMPSAKSAVSGQLYTGFHTRPTTAGGGNSLADSAHPPTGDCALCHGNTQAFGAAGMPSNHIPFAASATCDACHGNFGSLPTVGAIHANIPSIGSNCAQCHSPANAALYGANMRNGVPGGIVTLPARHIPTGTLGCEGCHVGANSSIAAVPVTTGAKFAGSLFNHSGTTVSCATCHGPSVTASTFAGVFPTTLASLTPQHVPTTAACDTCHGAAPTGLVPSSGMRTFANAQFSHAGISSGCASCHGPDIRGDSFYGITNIIAMPPSATAGPTSHLPTGTTCEDCHAGAKPSGLVPAVATRSIGSSLFRNAPPPSSAIHAGVTRGCSSCHEAAMSWAGVDVAAYARNYSTLQASANTLYRGFQTRPVEFGGGYSIANKGHPINGDCALCHGNTTAFGQPSEPPGHIPYRTGVGCNACHTSFGTAPEVTNIHANLISTSTNCEQCHSAANAAAYANTTLLRPIKAPSPNHIGNPSNLGCAACHVGAGTSTPTTPVTNGMTLANAAFSHSGISTGCAACHGPQVVAGTFDGVTPKTIASLTPSHIPVAASQACETCHIASVPTMPVPPTGYSGSPSFRGGQFTHTGISSDCAACHGPGVTNSTYYGVTSIVVMPATSGANAHIPSSNTCENCHLGAMPSGLLSVTQARSMPGSLFANRPPNSATIHAGISGNCSNCHEAGMSWVGMSAYPRSPATKNLSNPAQLYTGFHTRPQLAASGYSMADDKHPGAGDCSLCHGSTSAFGSPSMPSNHIPYAASASCTSCHAPWGQSPSVANIHANIQSTSTNCAQCHSATNAALYSSASRTIVAPDASHVPQRGLGCEACHIGAGSSITSLPVQDSARFSNSAFSHAGMTSNCAECHGAGAGPFQGISTLVTMPATSPAGATSHLPTGTTCENCHRGSMPSGLVPGNAAHAAPNSGFLTPAPTSAMVHSGVTGACASCHEKSMVWMGVSQYPITSSAPYRGFQTRPYSTATTFSVADANHPSTGECANCHSGFVEWATTVKPANHIPTANVGCTNCHTTGNYSDIPLLTAIHANAPSTTSNCAQCHSAANAAAYSNSVMTIVAPAPNHIPMGNLGCENCHVGSNSSITSTPVQNGARFANSAFSHAGVTTACASCHANVTNSTFQGGIIPVSMTLPILSPGHITNPAGLDCGSCHQAIPSGLARAGSTSTTFAGAMFSHSGITRNCDACHGAAVTGSSFKGITSIVVLPATASGNYGHIPSPINASCETCHLASTPSTLVAANATAALGATKFKSPAPTGAMIHTGVVGNCNDCHENGKTWININLYPPSPTSLTPGATYTGFQTRPISGGVTPSVNDPSHPGMGTGDCSKCHGSTSNFTALAKPSNHIPTSPTAQCQNCHTNLVTSGSSYVSSSINFSVLPTVTAIHTYAPSTTTNCAQCHSNTNADAYAIPSVGFAIKKPGSIANHIPFGSNGCEVCHVPASTPVQTGASFAGGKFSHNGFTTNCAQCHGPGVTSSTFTNVTAIVAIPATITGDAHIPYTAACEVCHNKAPSVLVDVNQATAGVSFASPLVTGATIHSNSTSFACKDCHERGAVWLGMGKYPRSPASVNLSTPTTQYRGFQTRPGNTATTYGYADADHTLDSAIDTGECSLCHVGTTYFTGVRKPTGHMPTTVSSCSACHVVAGDYSYAPGMLASNAVLHTGITIPSAVVKYASMGAAGCSACHKVGTGTNGTAPFAGCATQASCVWPPPVTYQPKTVAAVAKHVPIGALGCDACHVGTSSFAGVNMQTATANPAAKTMHENATLAGVRCMDCHELGMSWTNVLNLKVRTLSKHQTTAEKTNDCINCHTISTFKRMARVRPMMREALVSPDMGRIRPNLQGAKPSRGTMGNSFDHVGVKAGQCKTCHEGRAASGLPARHLMVTSSCDTCHRTSTWTPAQFNHNGISPNTCLACHNGMQAKAKPSGHFMSARSCDACHKPQGWAPVTYQHISPQYRPSAEVFTCVGCHVTNSEIVPRQNRGQVRFKPIQ